MKDLQKRCLALFAQQLVYTLYIVERVVDEETQFGHYTQLMAHALSERIAYLLIASLNVL
jgi:hypothetical protein